MADRRDEAKYKNQDLSLDTDRMVATVMGPDGPIGEVAFEFEVCPTCQGTGTHVNPNIDRQGLSPSEMDPGFREQYFSGAYDQPCNECGGRRVVPSLTPRNAEQEEIVAERRRAKEGARRSREIQRQERRMAMGRGMR